MRDTLFTQSVNVFWWTVVAIHCACTTIPTLQQPVQWNFQWLQHVAHTYRCECQVRSRCMNLFLQIFLGSFRPSAVMQSTTMHHCFQHPLCEHGLSSLSPVPSCSPVRRKKTEFGRHWLSVTVCNRAATESTAEVIGNSVNSNNVTFHTEDSQKNTRASGYTADPFT